MDKAGSGDGPVPPSFMGQKRKNPRLVATPVIKTGRPLLRVERKLSVSDVGVKGLLRLRRGPGNNPVLTAPV